MVNAGEYVSRSQTGNSILYDAQGNVMEAAGERKIEVELQGETDTSSKVPVLFREQVHVGPVSNPILCYGRLLENDWDITKVDGSPFLRHQTGVQVPVYYKGRSLVICGKIRSIEKVDVGADSVRAIKIENPPDKFKECPLGWSSVGDMRVCHSMQKVYVNPSDDLQASQLSYRTTLLKFEDGWRLVELCEDWLNVSGRNMVQTISWKYRECLTVMTRSPVSLEGLGLCLSMSSTSALNLESPSMPASEPASLTNVPGALCFRFL